MELKPAIQKYHWGRKGTSSSVAKLAFSNGIQISEDENYAELWMGTHPNGPSYVKSTLKPLSQFIEESSPVLGAKILENFGPKLPFLLKVLSVGKALSIQAHPNKQLAKELHANRPDLYKDDNHKPEMAIALTEFEMLCGFRRISEILQFTAGIFHTHFYTLARLFRKLN